MLERFERPLRIVCIILGALVLFQLGRLAFRRNPLHQLIIPPLPTLSTNAMVQGDSGSTNSSKAMVGKNSNSMAGASAEKKRTNAVSVKTPVEKSTNAAGEKSATVATSSTPQTDPKNTNDLSAARPGTNIVAAVNLAQTNADTTGTNSAALKEGDKKSTNSASVLNSPPRGIMPFPGPGGGKPTIPLPPGIQARVDKITQSEILAPVVRPLPMALLGIAGNSAFLRTSSGQSGVVKEGDELGGLKLLRIGTNRVLVEQDGEKKELMVFSGFGGESLLPKEKEQKETPK